MYVAKYGAVEDKINYSLGNNPDLLIFIAIMIYPNRNIIKERVENVHYAKGITVIHGFGNKTEGRNLTEKFPYIHIIPHNMIHGLPALTGMLWAIMRAHMLRHSVLQSQ